MKWFAKMFDCFLESLFAEPIIALTAILLGCALIAAAVTVIGTF